MALADLPHFNPDLDGESSPASVQEFRTLLRECNAVLISSPEYAHGVPGSLKNALDWIVRSGEFMYKPVALINASVSSTHAQASLTETLTVMMARVHAVSIPLASNKIDVETILTDPDLCSVLRTTLMNLTTSSESE